MFFSIVESPNQQALGRVYKINRPCVCIYIYVEIIIVYYSLTFSAILKCIEKTSYS